MRSWSRAERSRRHTIGFVPTMGYFHEGHLRLVDRARELADRVVVSIFVNPLQFGPGGDLARYPRDLPRDRKLAEARGVDCLFVPDAASMYPPPVSCSAVWFPEPLPTPSRGQPGPAISVACSPWSPSCFTSLNRTWRSSAAKTFSRRCS